MSTPRESYGRRICNDGGLLPWGNSVPVHIECEPCLMDARTRGGGCDGLRVSVESFLLGSVSAKVSEHAKCNVMIVRDAA